MRIPELRADDPEWFPPIESAINIDGQDGLLAVGGDLSERRLLSAYRNTIFPWFDEADPILWWTPSQRAVILADQIHVSRSMSRTIRDPSLRVTWNTAFADVMRQCAMPRRHEAGTWIHPAMIDAYCRMHDAGHAQSCEVWQGDELVGGIYGITLERAFFGESMFHRVSNASKLALISVAQSPQFDLIDCQMPSTHLESMGAKLITRAEFQALIRS
ncbi:MAG: leucyl/phenylalanyl-tRNA--protein transferase [Rubripirellula sp.]